MSASTNGAPDTDDKVLDLMPLVEPRHLVKIPTSDHPDGERFTIRELDDFGIEEQQRLLALQRRYQKLMSDEEELEGDDAEMLRYCFDELFDSVFDAPADIKRQLSDGTKAKVLNAFIAGPLLARQEAQMEIVNRLIAKKFVKQAQVDEAMAEIRTELAAAMAKLQTSTTES